MKLSSLLWCSIFVSLSYSSFADTVRTVRCKHDFARLGDSKFAVKDACGQPADSDIISGRDDVKVEQLYYRIQDGADKPRYVMTFVAGRLQRIERLR